MSDSNINYRVEGVIAISIGEIWQFSLIWLWIGLSLIDIQLIIGLSLIDIQLIIGLLIES